MNRGDFNAKNRSYMAPDMYAPGSGETLTIRDCREETKRTKDGKSWKVLQIWWMEERPPLDLSPTNIDWLVGTLGPDDDQWIRKKVHVWHDPTLRRGMALDVAKLDDSQRSRNEALKAAIAKTPNAKDPDDEIPF